MSVWEKKKENISQEEEEKEDKQKKTNNTVSHQIIVDSFWAAKHQQTNRNNLRNISLRVIGIAGSNMYIYIYFNDIYEINCAVYT